MKPIFAGNLNVGEAVGTERSSVRSPIPAGIMWPD